ncbi:MAG: hypothetical protein GY786_22500 [Proteobacteria bacterium]|nr:hypothetical protein [Pseudomonadota bacterium]
MINRQYYWLIIILSTAVLALSIWYGGRERWQSAGPETSDSPVSKYNLANKYHKQSKYGEAKSLLLEAINSPDVDEETLDKSLFNLGNNLFQVAVAQKDPHTALQNLEESQTYYRDLIDRFKLAQSRGETTDPMDPDLIHNATLVHQQIKVLKDQIKKQEQAGEGEKSIYGILKELVSRELQLQEQVKELEKGEDFLKRNLQRDQLLSEREKNREAIALLRNKIAQLPR